jgi:hypothetical protein
MFELPLREVKVRPVGKYWRSRLRGIPAAFLLSLFLVLSAGCSVQASSGGEDDSASPILLKDGERSVSLSGTVNDTSGGVIPGATIKVTRNESRGALSTYSNSKGTFEFPSLPAGTYTIDVSMEGFKSDLIQGVKLEGGAPVHVSSTMEVGSLSEEIVFTRTQAIVQPIATGTLHSLPKGIAPTYLRSRMAFLPSSAQSPIIRAAAPLTQENKDYAAATHSAARYLGGQTTSAGNASQFGSVDANVPILMKRGNHYHISIQLVRNDQAPGAVQGMGSPRGHPRVPLTPVMSVRMIADPNVFAVENGWPEVQTLSRTGAVFSAYVTPRRLGLQRLRIVVSDMTNVAPAVAAVITIVVNVVPDIPLELRMFVKSNWQFFLPMIIGLGLWKGIRRWVSGRAPMSKPQFERVVLPRLPQPHLIC